MMEQKVSTKKAILLTAVAKYSTVIIQVGFTMILSRILTPSEYGTVAIVSIFIAFFTLLSDLGFSAGIIQNKDLNRDDYSNIFSISIYLSIFLMLVFLSLSYPISHLYNDTIYLKLCPILSISVLFGASNMVPNALMLKHKQFKTIAIRTIVTSLLTSIITLILAIKGWGVYALCLQNISSAFLLFLWNEFSVKLKFKFSPSISSIKKIFGYSIFQFTSQTINFFCRQADGLLIGKLFSRADLAYYNKSYSLMMMPLSYIPGVINPVLHPILSEYQNDKYAIYDRYMRLCTLLGTVGYLISAACYTFGNEIIYFMFGNQWEPAELPFRILGISLFGQILTSTVGAIYQSIGDTKRLFHSVIINSIIIISFIIIGVLLGSIVTVSIMVSAAYIINYFVSFYILIHNGFGYSFSNFIKSTRYDFFIFILYIIIISFIVNTDNSQMNITYRILLYFSYCSIYLLPKKRYQKIYRLLRD